MSTPYLNKSVLARIDEHSDDEDESDVTSNPSEFLNGQSTPESDCNSADGDNKEEKHETGKTSSSSSDSSDGGNGKDGNGGNVNIGGTSPI